MPAQLRTAPTISDFQAYVTAMKEEREFRNDKNHAHLLLSKEVGELAQAMRMGWKEPDNPSTVVREAVARELADIFIYVLDLANQYGLSLEEAFRVREAENSKRTWSEYHHY